MRFCPLGKPGEVGEGREKEDVVESLLELLKSKRRVPDKPLPVEPREPPISIFQSFIAVKTTVGSCGSPMVPATP